MDSRSRTIAPAHRGGAIGPSRGEAEEAIRTLIAWAGDDPARDGLRETPRRAADALVEVHRGYRESAAIPLERTFTNLGGYDDIVLVRDIRFSSHCECHMVPFIGRAHVAYIPTDRIVGLSKLARVVDIFARRLQTQEKLTREIAGALDDYLHSRGSAVMLEAEHLCLTMRGVQAPGTAVVTTEFTGVFVDEPTVQKRFVALATSSR